VSRFLSARRLAGLVLILLTVGVATAVADDGRPSSNDDRGHAGASKDKPKEKEKDKDKPKSKDDGSPSSAAPATPSAPATTATPPAPAPAPTPVAPALPAAPVLGQTVGLAPVSGTVLVRAPGGSPVPLAAGADPLPTGSRVDARAGEVALTTALDAAGTVQTGAFRGGIFEVRQVASGKGLTRIVLVGGAWGACRATARRAVTATAHAAKKRKRKPVRSLWGSDDHGRFQTQGGGSVATVRGTRWLTEDFCDGTRTTVASGAVAVRSRRTGKTIVVRAGDSRFVAR
jgi:hypothetical protein